MPNKDNTRQINQTNGNSNTGSNEEVLAAIMTLNGRLTAVEEIILARLNDTRPFEKQLIAQLNEMNNKIGELAAEQAAMRVEQAAMRADQAAMREDQAAMREDQAAMRVDQAAMRVDQAAMREDQAAMRQDLTTLRKNHEEFCAETNGNFRQINKQMSLLSHASLKIHAEQELLPCYALRSSAGGITTRGSRVVSGSLLQQASAFPQFPVEKHSDDHTRIFLSNAE